MSREQAPDGRVDKTSVSQGHEMYCTLSGIYEFKPVFGWLGVHSTSVLIIFEPKL